MIGYADLVSPANLCTYAVGIQPDEAEYGNMAVYSSNNGHSTVKFDVANLASDGSIPAPNWITTPSVLKADGKWDGVAGNGEEWG